MKLVALGILVSILGVGCALQPGDPTAGDPTGAGSGGVVPQPIDHGFQLQPASTTGSQAPHPASTVPGQPEPSPWRPTPPVTDNMEPNEAPEPAPWLPTLNMQNDTAGTNPSGGTGSNGSGKSTGAAAPHGTTLGHWDLKDVATAN